MSSFTRQSLFANLPQHTLCMKTDPYTCRGRAAKLTSKTARLKICNGRVEVKGSKFVPTEKVFTLSSSAKCIGYRTISIAGTHDPIMIANIDRFCNKLRKNHLLSGDNNRSDNLFFHVYGKNGVMEALNPIRMLIT